MQKEQLRKEYGMLKVQNREFNPGRLEFSYSYSILEFSYSYSKVRECLISQSKGFAHITFITQNISQFSMEQSTMEQALQAEGFASDLQI